MANAITQSIGEQRRSGLIAAVLLLIAAVTFWSLGRWQLHRGEEQRTLEAEAQMAASLAPLDLRNNAVYEGDAFRRAVVDGIYDPTHQFYLQGRQHDGRSGYHVITALRIVGTRNYVLVNRGWIPGSVAAAAVPPGRVRVVGTLMRPELPPLRLGEPTGMTRPWIDPKSYGRESGRAVAPLLLVAAENGPGTVAVPTRIQSKKEMHVGYAIQWFAFTLIAAVAAAVLLKRQFRHD